MGHHTHLGKGEARVIDINGIPSHLSIPPLSAHNLFSAHQIFGRKRFSELSHRHIYHLPPIQQWFYSKIRSTSLTEFFSYRLFWQLGSLIQVALIQVLKIYMSAFTLYVTPG